MNEKTSGQTRITRNGRTVILESDLVRSEIEPDQGGKIRTFMSKRSGRNFFLVDSRARFTGPGYSDHDISGFDECFPTVAGCRGLHGSGRGSDMGDHGRLWQKPWTTNIHGDRVEMTCDLPELQCRFERTLGWLSPHSLRLDYAIENYGKDEFGYLYSAHPMLQGDHQTEFILPDAMKNMWVTLAINTPGVQERTWITWPGSIEASLNKSFDARRGSVVKLHSPPLKHGWAALRHRDSGEQLEIEFDTRALPHLGILVSQGYDTTESGYWRNVVFLGLEPTSGMGDDLDQCRSNGTLAVLSAGERKEFWITLSLVDTKE